MMIIQKMNKTSQVKIKVLGKNNENVFILEGFIVLFSVRGVSLFSLSFT